MALIQVSLLKGVSASSQGKCLPAAPTLPAQACLHRGHNPKTAISIKTQLPVINTATGRLKQFVPKMSIIMPEITRVTHD